MTIEDFVRLTAHTAINTDGWTNVGGIALENFTIAVDSTASISDSRLLRKRLEEFYPLPIKYLILTHYHQDHINGRQAFKDVQIICSGFMPIEKSRIKNAITFRDQHIIEDGKKEVQILQAGGHTVDSIFVYVPDEEILFAGDLIFENIFPPFSSDPTCNPELWIQALERIKSFKSAKIVPGHGPVLDGRTIDNHIANLQRIRQSIREAIKENIKPREIEISDYYGELHTRWLNGLLSHWYPFYKIIDTIPALVEDLQSNSREQNIRSLSQMTLKELAVLANHLKIQIRGNKNAKIEQIVDFMDEH
ncbi:MAG: MBL fold metallo-hydrolase [Candidatus Hodarchaeota archaeon]